MNATGSINGEHSLGCPLILFLFIGPCIMATVYTVVLYHFYVLSRIGEVVKIFNFIIVIRRLQF